MSARCPGQRLPVTFVPSTPPNSLAPASAKTYPKDRESSVRATTRTELFAFQTASGTVTRITERSLVGPGRAAGSLRRLSTRRSGAQFLWPGRFRFPVVNAAFTTPSAAFLCTNRAFEARMRHSLSRSKCPESNHQTPSWARMQHEPPRMLHSQYPATNFRSGRCPQVPKFDRANCRRINEVGFREKG